MKLFLEIRRHEELIVSVIRTWWPRAFSSPKGAWNQEYHWKHYKTCSFLSYYALDADQSHDEPDESDETWTVRTPWRAFPALFFFSRINHDMLTFCVPADGLRSFVDADFWHWWVGKSLMAVWGVPVSSSQLIQCWGVRNWATDRLLVGQTRSSCWSHPIASNPCKFFSSLCDILLESKSRPKNSQKKVKRH